jgi:hypothetical protein
MPHEDGTPTSKELNEEALKTVAAMRRGSVEHIHAAVGIVRTESGSSQVPVVARAARKASVGYEMQKVRDC